MTPKVLNYTSISQKNCCSYNLDTLAQLSTGLCNTHNNKELDAKVSFQKRARSKAFTNSYLFDLIDLNSPLQKAYWQTYHCSSVILQEGQKVTSRYCNQRWCLTCNRIRSAKMINGYVGAIKELKETQFVTLTIPNVKAKYLRTAIEDMTKSIKDIRKNLKKTYNITLKGLRKYECTYNAKEDTYHPHFHLIVEGKETANKLVDFWLIKNPKALRGAQDIQPAKEGTLKELCKYFTKVIAKDNDYNPKALDIMFRAVKGKRTFQPIGIKKDVSEDIEELLSQEINFKPPQTEIYTYIPQAYDWVSAYGETFSEYNPTKEDRKVINQDYAKSSTSRPKERPQVYVKNE